MVIAARGSGEPPQDNWSDPAVYPKDSNKGAGVPLYDTYKKLKAANPGLQFALEPAVYEAPPVSQLFSDPNNYLLSPRRGAFTALDAINATEQFCGGGVKYLLLGYSSGAWLIHILLHNLPNKLFNKVVGVGLYGDPQYAPGLAIDRDYQLSDKLLGVAWAGDPTDRSIPKSLGSVTYDACLPNDPVCQAPNPVTALECKNNDPACPHTRYVTDGVTEQVFEFLDLGLPPSSVWPVITSGRAPNGLVGTAYSWTPTVKPTARTVYTWGEDGVLPAGLTFSTTTGAVTGTPTKAGIYGFSITVTSTQQRTASQFENVVINSGGPLSISPSSLTAATVGTAYKVSFTGDGGYLPYTWKATGDALSHGLQFTVLNQDSTTTTLSGTPDQAGTFGLDVTLTDAKGGSTTQSYSLTVASAPTPTGTDDWTQPGYDAGLTRNNTAETTLTTANVGQLAPKWSRSGALTPSLEYKGLSYSVEWTQTFTGAYGDFLVGRSVTNGSVQFSQSLGQYAQGSEIKAIGNGIAVVRVATIFGGWRTYTMAGYSLSDGSQLWHLNWSDLSQVVLDGNKLIASPDGGWIGEIDLATGAIIWSDNQYKGTGAIVVSHGTIATVGRSWNATTSTWYDYMEGLSETDGSQVWADTPLTQPGDYFPLAATGTTLFDTNPITATIEARDLTTGKVLWQTPDFAAVAGTGSAGESWSNIAVSADGNTIYLVTTTEDSPVTQVYTVTARAFTTGGTELWRTQLPQHGFPQGVVLANGVMYTQNADYSTNTEVAYTLRASDGQLLWTSPAEPEQPNLSLYVAAGYLDAGTEVFGLP